MKIVVIGGGPSGLRITDKLSQNQNNEVFLYEKEEDMGGCWKVDWKDNLYTEHSPRVVTTGYTKTLELFKVLKVDVKELYGGRIGTSMMFASYIFKNLSTLDLCKFLLSMYTIPKTDKRTVEEWINDNSMSENGSNVIRKFSLSIGASERRMTAYCLFSAISEGQGSKFLQLVKNDEWVKKYESILNQRSNVEIFKNSKLNSIHGDNLVDYIMINKKKIEADIYICAIPLYALRSVLKSSDESIQNNWGNYNKFKKYCIDSTYSGIGIQLHFDNEMPNPNTWTTPRFTDWCIEVLPISDYSGEFTKDKNVKTVWSCVIVDTYSKSKFLDKTVNDLKDINKVIDETIRQLELCFNFKIYPCKTTIAKGVRYNTKIKMWDMEHSAFNPSKHGELKSKGKIDNLYSVGPHNLYEISALESALNSADMFVEEINQNLI